MIDWMQFVALGGALASVIAAGDLEETLVVPSGLGIYLQELDVKQGAEGSAVARFRYVMPELANPAIEFEDVERDFAHLCQTHILPTLERRGQTAQTAIVSIADREIAFGVATPAATQYFEGFTVEDGTCIWEAF
jgi:hypothetical protein